MDYSSLNNNLSSTLKGPITIAGSKRKMDSRLVTETRKSRRLKSLAPIDIRDYDYNNNLKIEIVEEFFKKSDHANNNLNVDKIKQNNKQEQAKNECNLYLNANKSFNLDKSLKELHKKIKTINNIERQNEEIEISEATSTMKQVSTKKAIKKEVLVKPKTNLKTENAKKQFVPIDPALDEKKLIFITYLGLRLVNGINSKENVKNENKTKNDQKQNNNTQHLPTTSSSTQPNEDKTNNTNVSRSGHTGDPTSSLKCHHNTNRKPHPRQRTQKAIDHKKSLAETVQKIINKNSRISINKIVDILSPDIKMGYSAVRNIIINILKLKKKNSRWIPHSMTNSNIKTKVSVNKCTGKNMVNCFKMRKNA